MCVANNAISLSYNTYSMKLKPKIKLKNKMVCQFVRTKVGSYALNTLLTLRGDAFNAVFLKNSARTNCTLMSTYVRGYDCCQ